MSGVRIPAAAYAAAATAYDLTDLDSGWSEAVDAAAPLIVAAELWRLAGKGQGTGPFREFEQALLITRAEELDPEGLTRD